MGRWGRVGWAPSGIRTTAVTTDPCAVWFIFVTPELWMRSAQLLDWRVNSGAHTEPFNHSDGTQQNGQPSRNTNHEESPFLLCLLICNYLYFSFGGGWLCKVFSLPLPLCTFLTTFTASQNLNPILSSCLESCNSGRDLRTLLGLVSLLSLSPGFPILLPEADMFYLLVFSLSTGYAAAP